MNGQACIEIIKQAGFTLGHRGGNIVVSPISKLTPQQRGFIKAHKPEILQALAGQKPGGKPADHAQTVEHEQPDHAAYHAMLDFGGETGPTPEIDELVSELKAMRAARASCAASAQADPGDAREYFEERAAVLEFDQGFTRDGAEREAAMRTTALYGEGWR